jgi:molecular chaperone DnaK
MSHDNKTIGNFELTGIPAAPRGVPQVEVTFDIDANGIVHVSAKDLGTGKEQSISITASSGLSKEEINKMVRDAEAHSDEDKRKREAIEARNHADSMVYSTEKSLKEFGDKISAVEKGTIENKITELKKLMEGDDAEAIKKGTDELAQSAHKLAEAMYAKPAGTEGDAGSDAKSGGEPKPKDDNVVDADFEEVKSDKK